MSALECITKDMQQDRPRPRACTIQDEHRDGCYLDNCSGCLPRKATHGLLCSHCFSKAEDTIRRVGDMIMHLRSIEGGGQAIGERVSTSLSIRLPVPQSWMTADELVVALGGQMIPSTASIDDTAVIVAGLLEGWRDVLARVSTVEGAKQAVTTTLVLQTALARWPEAEAKERDMPTMQCSECGARDLVRKAPLEYLGDLFVDCRSCGFRQDWFEWVSTTVGRARLWERAQRDAERRARSQKQRERSA